MTTKRSVEYEMRMRSGQLKVEARETAHEIRNIDDAVEDLERDLRKLPADAAEAAVALHWIDTAAERTGKQVKTTAVQFDALKDIDKRISNTRKEMEALALQFRRTGDPDVLRGLQEADKELKQLEQDAALVNRTMFVSGSRAGTAFSGGFMEAVTGLSAEIWPVLAAGAVVLVPEILGAIGGAVSTGVGLGGLAAGIAGAFHDPQVQAAAHMFGQQLKTEFFDATSVFRGPTIAGLQGLSTTTGVVMAHLKKDFADLAPYEGVFVTYLREAAEKLMPGIDTALHAAGPILSVFARDLPVLTRDVSVFLEEISSGGRGGAEALDTVLRVVGQLIVFIGALIQVGENWFDTELRIANGINAMAAAIPSWVTSMSLMASVTQHFGQKSHDSTQKIIDDWNAAKVTFGQAGSAWSNLATPINTVTIKLDEQATALHRVNDAMSTYLDQTLSADEAAIHWQQDMADLRDSVHQYGTSLDITTEAGRRNKTIIDDMIRSAQQQRDEALRAAGDDVAAAKKANDAYNSRIQKIDDFAKSLGIAKAAADALAGTYKVNIDYVFFQTGAPPTQAVNGSYWNIGTGRVGGMRYGGISPAAGAGIYPDTLGPLIRFAEPGTGHEGFLPEHGISHDRAGDLLAKMAAWSGHQVIDPTHWRAAPMGGGGDMPPVNIRVEVIANGRVLRDVMINDAVGRGKSEATIQVAYP